MMPQDAVSQDELIERERLMDAIMGIYHIIQVTKQAR